MRSTLVSFVFAVSAGLAAVQSPSAVERLADLRASLKKSHDANDWQTNLVHATALKGFLNESPNSLLEIARADVRVGDMAAAFREVEQFVHMGQATEVFSHLADFAALREAREFAKIQNDMEANRQPVSRGEAAFSLQDSDLLAEDVAFDAADHLFFVTSVREKKIVAFNMQGKPTEFAVSPNRWPMMALKIDPAHHLLWATEVGLQGFNSVPAADQGRSALLCYDLKTKKLLRRVEGPKSALGDMALMANGDVVVSDGSGGGIYRLASKGTTLERMDNGDFISPQTVAVHPDGKHLFVPDYVRGLGVLDIATKQVRWVSAAGRFALSGIDGFYFDRGRLIAVQNGTSPERVIVFKLDATLSKVEAETVIERASATLGDPTHGVLVGDDFYYLANSGWDRMDDHGEFQPGTKPSAPLMMRVKMSKLQ